MKKENQNVYAMYLFPLKSTSLYPITLEVTIEIFWLIFKTLCSNFYAVTDD